MSEARRVRRSVPGLAGIVLTVLAASSGCMHIPVPRANTAPVHIPPPVPVGSAKAEDQAAELASLDERELLPPLPAHLVAASMPEEKPAGTPMLDETLARIRSDSPGEPITPSAEANARPRDRNAVEEEDPSESREESATEDRSPESAASAADPKSTALRALKGDEPTAERGGTPIDPERPAKAVDPRELWNDGLARLQALAGQQVKVSGTDPSPWALRARLLELVARSETAGDPARQPLWRLAESALTIGEPSAPDDRTRAAEIRAAVEALEDQSPLEITDLQLCRKVTGFGEFEPIDAADCRAGHPMIVYCEMSGLRYAPTGDSFQSRLTSTVELVPARGGEPVWTKALGTAVDTCRRRRRDYYVNYRIVLAENLPPGSYELRLKQADDTAGRSTSSSIPLTIQP